MQTPLPLRLRRFASYGYAGKGALIAMDCATESDIGTGAGILAGSGCTAGRGRFFGRGFFSTGATVIGESSAGGCSFDHLLASDLVPSRRLLRRGSALFLFG